MHCKCCGKFMRRTGSSIDLAHPSTSWECICGYALEKKQTTRTPLFSRDAIVLVQFNS